MARNELAEKLELVGSLFEIDGMSDLLSKFEKDMGVLKFNAVVIHIESLLMKNAPEIADRMIAMKIGITQEDVEKMDDAEYSNALKETIISDALGFFASSPRSDGKK